MKVGVFIGPSCAVSYGTVEQQLGSDLHGPCQEHRRSRRAAARLKGLAACPGYVGGGVARAQKGASGAIFSLRAH